MREMEKVGVIIAMQKEWDTIFADKEKEGRTFAIGQTNGGLEYVAMISGIGKVNAGVCAYRLCKEYEVGNILSFGCAGGSSYDVHVGDVIVGDEYIYYDVNCGSPNAVGQVQGCPETFKSAYEQWSFLREYRHGLIASGDTFVESELMAEAITKALYPEHCPLALDMESAAVAQVCEERGVGFTSVRVISDNPLSGERTYEEFWKDENEMMYGLFSRFLSEE